MTSPPFSQISPPASNSYFWSEDSTPSFFSSTTLLSKSSRDQSIFLFVPVKYLLGFFASLSIYCLTLLFLSLFDIGYSDPCSSLVSLSSSIYYSCSRYLSMCLMLPSCVHSTSTMTLFGRGIHCGHTDATCTASCVNTFTLPWPALDSILRHVLARCWLMSTPTILDV